MHIGRARTIAVLLTIQAGLAVYSGARAARAFMQTVSSREERPAAVSDQPDLAHSDRAISSVITSGFQEIIDPWQPLPRIAASTKGDESINPWREKTASIDPELIDPWPSERTPAASPVASFDLNTAEAATGLLNPWPTVAPSRDFELPELVDPWSTTL